MGTRQLRLPSSQVRNWFRNVIEFVSHRRLAPVWASKRGGIQLLTQVLMCEWVLELPTRRTYVYASTYICEPEQGVSVTQTVTIAFDPRSADSALYSIVFFTYLQSYVDYRLCFPRRRRWSGEICIIHSTAQWSDDPPLVVDVNDIYPHVCMYVHCMMHGYPTYLWGPARRSTRGGTAT